MSKPIFVDWCPKDVLDGVQALEPMEELAYRRILDLIYTTNDNLPDDDKRLAWMTKTGRKWVSIRQTLIAMGKIEAIEGRISNHRCRETLQKVAQKIEQKVEAGKASAEYRKSLKNIETPSTDVEASVTTDVPTTQEPKNPIGGGGDAGAHAYTHEAGTDPAQTIANGFVQLRSKYWPNECRPHAPMLTLKTEAQGFLDQGGTVPLICEVLERGMRTAAAQGKTATSSLRAFRLSLTDAIANHRTATTNTGGPTHGNRNHHPAATAAYDPDESRRRTLEAHALAMGRGHGHGGTAA